MKNSKLDELLVHQTRESIMIRLESFGDEFERLAKTAKQGVLAERFNVAVSEFAKGGPVTAADLEPLGDWIKGYGDGFEELARTPDQKKLAASFREFINEVTSLAVKEAFQRPLVKELLNEHAVHSKTDFERLLVEQRDDAAQRPLHEKGVRYEDEPNALREILDGKTQGVEINKGAGEQERGGIER